MKNLYEICGDITFVFINKKGKSIRTTIDTAMLEKVKSMPGTWGYSTDGSERVYVRWRRNDGTCLQMHRLIADCPAHLVVDHIDGNTLNNRASNLRVCTQTENMWNCRRPTTGGLPDISKKDNGWEVKVGVHYLGFFYDKYEATRKATLFRVYNDLPVRRYPVKVGDTT